MQNLIKKIRTHLNLSQAEFAEQLNVSFATVNRWENGRALPNKLAQSGLYRFCREKKIPVYEMTLQRIEEISQEIQLPEKRVLLFHGSKSGIEGPIEPKSRKYCDFGRGFYMGTDSRQALTLVCDFEDARFYILSMDLEGLDVLTVPVNILVKRNHLSGELETVCPGRRKPIYMWRSRCPEDADLQDSCRQVVKFIRSFPDSNHTPLS